jgi:hypothetical protein
MTELYPSDEQLAALSGSVDARQEVQFIPVGQTPYHLSFYKMLYRLLDVACRAGDLRVYKDGEMTFGVRAGKYFDGAAIRDFAGAAAQALSNNAVNSIYLLPDGTLGVGTAGLPSPAGQGHIPLAQITTSAGQYALADIVDYRGAALYSPPGAAGVDGGVTTAKLADGAVTAAKLAGNIPAAKLATASVAIPLPVTSLVRPATLTALTASDGASLGILVATAGTGGSVLQSSSPATMPDRQVIEAARVMIALPRQYVAGSGVQLRLHGRITAAIANSTCVEVFVYRLDNQGGCSYALCAGLVRDLTTAWSDLTFPISAGSLAPGDMLDVLMTVYLDDAGGSSVGKAQIGRVELLMDVQG